MTVCKLPGVVQTEASEAGANKNTSKVFATNNKERIGDAKDLCGRRNAVRIGG